MTTTPQLPPTTPHGGTTHGPRIGHAPPRRARRRLTVAAGVAALALSAGVVTSVAWSAGTDAAFRNVAEAGAHPFMAPVGVDRAGVLSLPALAGPQPGGLAELYAQDPAAPSCDAAALLENLQADPARAAAWGAVLGVAPERIAGFVGSLTPVTLRANTAVIDHGYSGGTFEATPAVLAAGTAVFVDSYGAPTVRCFSGNPLTPGASTDPAVTVVQPSAAPLTVNVFHHPGTNLPHQHAGKPPYDGQHHTPADPVTGTVNYDGTVTLSDGRLVRADGTIVELPAPPAGSTPLPGGGYMAGGTAYNADGTPRVALDIMAGIVVQPDGTVTPSMPYFSYQWNYDGTLSSIYDGPADGMDNVLVWGADGQILHSGANGNYDPATGSVVDADGTRLNHTGTEREDVELPGGAVLTPNGPVPPVLKAPAAPVAPADPAEETPASAVEEAAPGEVAPEEGAAGGSDATDDAPTASGASAASGDGADGGEQGGEDAAPTGDSE